MGVDGARRSSDWCRVQHQDACRMDPRPRTSDGARRREPGAVAPRSPPAGRPPSHSRCEHLCLLCVVDAGRGPLAAVWPSVHRWQVAITRFRTLCLGYNGFGRVEGEAQGFRGGGPAPNPPPGPNQPQGQGNAPRVLGGNPPTTAAAVTPGVDGFNRPAQVGPPGTGGREASLPEPRGSGACLMPRMVDRLHGSCRSPC